MKKFLLIILTGLLITQATYIFAMDKDKQDETNQEQKKDIEMDPEELYQLGLAALDNNEFEKAFEYMDKAARQNHLEAQVELTYMLFEGKGCKTNLVGALNICQLVREISYTLANESYQAYDDENEKYYNNIYIEFDNLWKKIMTKLVTEDVKITKLISVLDLSEKKDSEIKPIQEDVLNSMFC